MSQTKKELEFFVMGFVVPYGTLATAICMAELHSWLCASCLFVRFVGYLNDDFRFTRCVARTLLGTW